MSDVTSIATEPDGDVEVELKGLITSPLVHQSDVFDDALRLISSIQTSPSCTRLAATTLITSCQAIAGPEKDSEHAPSNSRTSLDDVKSMYAARLALCELVGAGAEVPSGCAPLMPSENTKSKQGFQLFKKQNTKQRRTSKPGYEEIGEQQLGQCLKALESRPQWWTSYSNNRQNAVVMCHAARAQIEKG